VSRRASEVEQHVGEVRSEVYNLRNALREVRALVEGVPKKAESPAVQLGRVARLEAEGSSLRTTPVVPPTESPAFVPVASTRPPAKQNSNAPPALPP
jgi:hypothetical protein